MLEQNGAITRPLIKVKYPENIMPNPEEVDHNLSTLNRNIFTLTEPLREAFLTVAYRAHIEERDEVVPKEPVEISNESLFSKWRGLVTKKLLLHEPATTDWRFKWKEADKQAVHAENEVLYTIQHDKNGENFFVLNSFTRTFAEQEGAYSFAELKVNFGDEDKPVKSIELTIPGDSDTPNDMKNEAALYPKLEGLLGDSPLFQFLVDNCISYAELGKFKKYWSENHYDFSYYGTLVRNITVILDVEDISPVFKFFYNIFAGEISPYINSTYEYNSIEDIFKRSMTPKEVRGAKHIGKSTDLTMASDDFISFLVCAKNLLPLQ